jgi:hypothetical protein
MDCLYWKILLKLLIWVISENHQMGISMGKNMEKHCTIPWGFSGPCLIASGHILRPIFNVSSSGEWACFLGLSNPEVEDWRSDRQTRKWCLKMK